MGNTRKIKNAVGEWANMLSEVSECSYDPPPPEWQTARQVAEETGMSVSHTQKLLYDAVKAGRAEKKRFHIKQSTRFYPIPHYRILR